MKYKFHYKGKKPVPDNDFYIVVFKASKEFKHEITHEVIIFKKKKTKTRF